MSNIHIDFDNNKLVSLAQRWHIAKITLFGSVLRDDFKSNSDVDVMVKFSKDACVDLLDFVNIKDEMQAIFGRLVDLVEEGTIKNPYRKKNIANNIKVIYASAG